MFPLVYEINTRVWLRHLSEQYQRPITLGNIPDSEFRFFKHSGFDFIWLMGIWRPSRYSEAIARSHRGLRSVFLEQIDHPDPCDIVASPYSIPEYRINPLLGDESELAELRKRLAADDIRLMLDFVPNHMALDNKWLPDHPEFFVTVSSEEQCIDPESCFEYRHNHFLAHGKDPYFPSWTDTLQLNYSHFATHNMMTENLMTIAQQCDAVRCDVAMLELKSVYDTTWGSLSGPMPEEFWGKAISAVKQLFPDFIFLAESYWDKEWELQQQGFDFTYDKPFYDYMTAHPVAITRLKGHLEAEWNYQSHLCRFLENHDEARAATKLGPNHLPAALVLMTVPGMHLIHQGQLEGYRLQLPVQLLRQASEPFNSELPEVYHEIFMLSKHDVFRKGDIEHLDINVHETSNCIGFRRFSGQQSAFVLANFTSTGIDISFSHNHFTSDTSLVFKVFSTQHQQKNIDFVADEHRVRVKLSPHEGLVLECG
ncbi:MAG: alpha-amylase family glycosyl hydrolase [Prosthecochloris sp.]|uniref:Alpha amylase catalytic region n=1 Tax=Prosthecochloris aestuarii (strain DSM 271 / SK 413) TaxID=290512 RepID=B4S3G3_PROA2|nr:MULTISPECIES: alpha-amylase family glycosyl hydrolase [Prosthecochloris]ACF46702.1 alpha amylase catalytic region [Prosthecochloris aestuarii DSM 271]MCW8798493.1 alpha-amylase family glycosyl hydrolase [Prosthecochloris sp.]